MNVITKALSDVTFRIPPQILETVFIKRLNNWTLQNTSLTDAIMQAVIRPRVLTDCNIVGGQEVYIPLAGLSSERVDDYISIFRIPKERTQGRSILSVLNITFNDPSKAVTYGAMNATGASAMLRAGQAMMDSVGAMPVTSTSSVSLIAENTVMVRDYIFLPSNIYLRCKIANTDDLSNIHIRAYKHFSRLFTLAVKAYIYNESIVRMDMGQIVAGNQIGAYKDVIDGYSDAEEMYTEYLDTIIGKVQFMNDPIAMQRHIKSMIGSMR